MEGVEPTHLSALDPKSSVSANFTTSAKKSSAKVMPYSKFEMNKVKIASLLSLIIGIVFYKTF